MISKKLPKNIFWLPSFSPISSNFKLGTPQEPLNKIEVHVRTALETRYALSELKNEKNVIFGTKKVISASIFNFVGKTSSAKISS